MSNADDDDATSARPGELSSPTGPDRRTGSERAGARSAPTQPREAGRYLVLGTAGHIDHGKTSLVRALTGTDTDRLAEEKARGITIDLGFAQWRLPDGTQLGIIDVPGHRRF